jgi:hypothetical protein
MKLEPNHICVAKVTLPGNWPMWYLARIVAYDEDAQGNWSVDRFRLIGETFDRDSHAGLYVIRDQQKETAAQKLAGEQWGVKPYKDLDEVRAAIIGKETEWLSILS